jgi:RimJ/RimL family protein N-acetyltransferase
VDLCALPDGRVVTIRPIRPDDTGRLQRSHERLSDESRYRRFMAAKPQLSTADARYFVDVDGCDHYALVATVTGSPADPGSGAGGEPGSEPTGEPEREAIVAVARFVRLPQDPATAEFAIVVGDAWQRQGLGGELLGRLADAAVTRGVVRFSATILADNLGIRRTIDRLAAGPVTHRRQGNTIDLEFPLPTRAGPTASASAAA